MRIETGVLGKITDQQAFHDFVVAHAIDTCRYCALTPQVSMARMQDAYGAWAQDIKRVSKFELKDGEPDHFKQSAHLAYWLRRMAPISDFTDNAKSKNGGEVSSEPFSADMRKLLFDYAPQYLAFDLGLQICLFHETGMQGGIQAGSLRLSRDYVHTMVHFLKFKNVSPHALFLIYKSLFVGLPRETGRGWAGGAKSSR